MVQNVISTYIGEISSQLTGKEQSDKGMIVYRCRKHSSSLDVFIDNLEDKFQVSSWSCDALPWSLIRDVEYLSMVVANPLRVTDSLSATLESGSPPSSTSYNCNHHHYLQRS